MKNPEHGPGKPKGGPRRPTHRRLRGYVFDPSFSATIDRRENNEVIYKIRWEDTEPGPVGEYIEVVDYDPTKQCFYEPVDLKEEYVMAGYGLNPSEGDPRFHQQQVYAVAMCIIEQFERALGRRIIWTRRQYSHSKPEFVRRLRIYPHAMRQQNAYYSPQKMALLFGYFQASENWSGRNVPGTAVFTCLSPDIVAHELTHAILDTMHPNLRWATNPDMLAFHEGFSDIIALLQRFVFTPVVEEQIRNSRGDLLSAQNFLGDLAIQFGQAMPGKRRALRSFLVETGEDGATRMVQPDRSKYHTLKEPHSRGGVLVAAVFDAFTKLYHYRVADLVRLATNGTGVLAQGELHPDLVKRLSEEACDIAGKLMLVCIRALDYCPPVDLGFGDYLRALITADVEHNPEDTGGLRYALLESFRSWGIVPKDINTYSVESLMWKPLEEYYGESPELTELTSSFRAVFDPDKIRAHTVPDKYRVTITMEKILRENDRKSIFEQSQILAAAVHELFELRLEFFKPQVEHLLGMCFNSAITYELSDGNYSEAPIRLSAIGGDVFQVNKCRPVIRHNGVGSNPSKLLLINFLQRVDVDLAGSAYQGYLPNDTYKMRGGATLIIDLSDYSIKYAIVKNIASSERLKEQLNYAIDNLHDAENAALLMQGNEPFAALHSH